MNETDNAVFACNSCSASNAPQNKFCSGCGQSLWEKCHQCGTSCRIGQNFCNGCGFNLLSEMETRLADARALIQKAQAASDEGRFKDGIRLLSRQTKVSDSRFTEIQAEATSLVEEFQSQLDKWSRHVEDIRPQADSLVEQRQFKSILELLEPIPAGMLDDALSKYLSEARESLSLYAESKADLKSAVDLKDWPSAATHLVRLLEIKPQSEKYTQLLQQVARKVLKSATQLKQTGKHAAALQELEAIPQEFQSEEHSSLAAELEELIFVRKLVARTRHLSPLVGVCLERLRSLTPDDTKVQTLIERFRSVRKSPSDGMAKFRSWMENETGQIPGGILPVTFPPQLPGSRPDRLLASGAQFWTAYGAALQCLGMGDDSGELEGATKKSVLSLLSRKKKANNTFAWGIDIGDSHIKAIKLSRIEDTVRIEDALMYEIPAGGSTRAHLKKPEASAVLKCLKEMFVDGALQECAVAVNVSAADLLTRHMVVPVNAPKQHQAFIEQEAQANIPIAMDLLATAYHKFDPADASAMSQNVLLAAVKRVEVESRKSFLEQVGASSVVVVPEPFALFNLVRHCKFFGLSENNTRDVTLVIDVGFSRSSINLISRSGGWFRAIDWGIEDLTRSLATEMKITHADAEKLRLNPSGCPQLNRAIEALEAASIVPRRELSRSLISAKEQLADYKFAHALLIGGGSGQSLLSSWINGEDL